MSECACLAKLGWLWWLVALAGSGPSSPPRCTLLLASLLVPWGRVHRAMLSSALHLGAVASHGHSHRHQHAHVSSVSCRHIVCVHTSCIVSPLPLLRAPTAPTHGRVAIGLLIKALRPHKPCRLARAHVASSMYPCPLLLSGMRHSVLLGHLCL